MQTTVSPNNGFRNTRLLGHFNSFRASVELGARWLHKPCVISWERTQGGANHEWSKNRTGENRTGEPRPSTRGPFRGHLRGMFRGESLKGWKQENQPLWVLSWGLLWADSWGHSWTHSWGHSWAHSWVEVRFRLFCASSNEVHIVNWNTGISVCTSRFGPFLFHCLCAIFAPNSRFMCLFQAPLDTCLNSPSWPASQFTVCTSPLKGAFEKRKKSEGLADRGGWREEILPMPETDASFLHPFSLCPLGGRRTVGGKPFLAAISFCVTLAFWDALNYEN